MGSHLHSSLYVYVMYGLSVTKQVTKLYQGNLTVCVLFMNIVSKLII